MELFKATANRFQMSYKAKEVPIYTPMEQFLMDDLVIPTRSDVHKVAIKNLYLQRKQLAANLLWKNLPLNMTPARNYSFALYAVNPISAPRISRIFLQYSSTRHMKPIKARQLSKIQHLVPNNPRADLQLTNGKHWDSKAEAEAKKNTLYDAAYRTSAGHWKRSDEPSEAEQFRQSDQIKQVLSARRKKEAQERLKSKGAVPTKQGKKLFDQFMKEANTHRPPKVKSKINTRSLKDLENAYNAASALEFDHWVIFMNDLFDTRV